MNGDSYTSSRGGMNPTGSTSAGVKQERVTDVAVRPADRHNYSSSREYHVGLTTASQLLKK